MVQRVKAIDKILIDYQRFYIWLDHKGGCLPKWYSYDNSRIALRLNLFLYFVPVWLYLMINRSPLYVHSVVEATKVAGPILFGNKVILDLHGVVPEEMEYAGKNSLARLFTFIEYLTVIRAVAVIGVTKKLIEHVKAKYKLSDDKFILLPIFQKQIRTHITKTKNVRPVAMYAGGIQAWQNIDHMLLLATKNPEVDFLLLVSNKKSFIDKFGSLVCNLENVQVASVPHEEVQHWYNKADFGIILRDNNVVNRVACPTKLIEYIENDLIPVISTCNIGDFVESGMRFIRANDFNIKTANEARQHHDPLINLKLIGLLDEVRGKGTKSLKAVINGITAYIC